jgi:3-dehydroquinate synthase
VGHSLEKLSAYKIPHGHAVARGMVVESRAAFRMGLTEFDASSFLTETLLANGFDLTIPYSGEEILKYALNDKKISGDSIAMVIPEAVGKCRLQKIPLSELGQFLALGME